jgi:hypothetical protein
MSDRSDGRPKSNHVGGVNDAFVIESFPQTMDDLQYCAMINRAALIVRPRKPYLDWAASVDDSGLVPDSNDEQTVYLIPAYEDDRGAQRILKKVFAQVFEDQLCDWCVDESVWPVRRDFKIFCEWFTFELHSIVEDLCEDEAIWEDD